MATKNRATQIAKVLKVVKKHFKPAPERMQRTLLEHLLFACCVENSLDEDADRVYQSLASGYFDWNEVRVSTVRELGEIMKPLNDPERSATRLKRVLQSVFETHYSFDLEPLKKQNIGQSAKQIASYNGSTPFVVAYVTQNALGGHSIPVNRGLLESMRIVEVISDSEASKGSVPGLERAVPKTKGYEVGSMLHQLGVEMSRSPYGPTIRKILLEIEPSCKDQLPKRPAKKPAAAPETAEKPAAQKQQAAKKSAPSDDAATGPVKKKKKKVVKKSALPRKKVKKKKSAAAAGTKKKVKTSAKKIRKKKPR